MGGWKIALWALVVLLVFTFLYLVRGILLPFVVAFILSVLLEPTIRRLRARGYSRFWAVMMVVLSFLLSVTALVIWLAPTISTQFQALNQTTQALTRSLYSTDGQQQMSNQAASVERVIDRYLTANKRTLENFNLPTSRKGFVERFVEPRREQINQSVAQFFGGALGMIGTAFAMALFLLFTPIFLLMILLDMEHFKTRTASWIPPAIRHGTIAMFSDVANVFSRYLRGITFAVLGYMTMSTIILLSLNVPYAYLLAILFGTLYVVPFLGGLINFAVLFLITGLSGASGNWFLSFGSPWVFAAAVTGIFAVAHFTYDNLVYPQMVGRAVGLHPLVSMFVIFSGAALFGLVGMLLAFPLAGAAKVVLERLLRVTTSVGLEGLELAPIPLRHRTASEV